MKVGKRVFRRDSLCGLPNLFGSFLDTLFLFWCLLLPEHLCFDWNDSGGVEVAPQFGRDVSVFGLGCNGVKLGLDIFDTYQKLAHVLGGFGVELYQSLEVGLKV